MKITLTKGQIRAILTNLICVKILFMYPRSLTKNAGSAGWIQVVYVSLIAFILFWINMKLYTQSGHKNILKISEELFGSLGKRVVGICCVLLFSVCAAFTIRSFPEVIKMVLLPITPTELILIVFGIAVFFGCTCGISALSAIHALFLPIAAVLIFLFLFFLIPESDFRFLFPIFGNGTDRIFCDGLSSLDIFADLLSMQFLLPYAEDFTEAKKGGYQAFFLSAAFSTAACFFFAAAYPYPVSESFLFPFYQLARLIHVGEFFQRMEAFFEFMWSIGILLYSSFYLWLICRVLCESFSLQFQKPIVFPVLCLLISAAYLFGGTNGAFEHSAKMSLFIIGIAYFLPMILGIGAVLKRRRAHADS